MGTAAETEEDPAGLEAARCQDERSFERLVGPHRRGLLAHCYRMLGSGVDAEDAVQETLLRAWRGLPRFEGRSSLRSWLYRIATNVCLKAIERRPRRVLPLDYGPPTDPHASTEPPLAESVWLDPFPDEGLGDELASPEARYEQREGVELAFIAALQHLPGRQRAVLVLRDVLGFAPAEIAATLDASLASIYSALQRAHAAVEERLPERNQQATLRSLDDAQLRELVRRYTKAWEEADVAALTELLADEATLAMPPRPSWYRGRAAVGAFLAAGPLSGPGRWRQVRVGANGQLAFGVYGPRDAEGAYRAHVIKVLTLGSDARIAAVTAFHAPGPFARFGLPEALAP